MKPWAALIALCACTSRDAQPARVPRPGALIQLEPAAIVFQSAPPTMPAGVQLAVLEGDPKSSGIFSVRMKVPPGFTLPLHTHPSDERVTVLEGAVAVGFALQAGPAARTFNAGAYYVNPAGLPHYVTSEQGATLQITGLGPWKVDFVASAAH